MNFLTDVNVLDKTKEAMQEFIEESKDLKQHEPSFTEDIDAELLDLCRILFLNSIVELYPGADISNASELAQQVDKNYLELMYDK